MRLPRLALAAVMPFAIAACSEEPTEPVEPEESAEAAGEFGQDVPPPPPSSWGDDGFVDDGGSGDPLLNEPAESAEDLR
ncbi:MAG: hypothetical protein QNJ15_04475 [Erythrobacter sp.]|nr:hypothetical protein [Erythrobacter sp.]